MYSKTEIPRTIPLMSVRDTVFFPQSILPLYIFEPQYQTMLRDVLAGNRIFAVARAEESPANTAAGAELPGVIATAGMVRAAHQNPDGTSNLVLQGLSRVEIKGIAGEHPYRSVEVERITTRAPLKPEAVDVLRREVDELIFSKKELSNGVPEEFLQFLQTIEDPGVFIDLTANSTCECSEVKQRLLETLDLELRYETYVRYLRQRMERYRFFQRLQGGLADDAIFLN